MPVFNTSREVELVRASGTPEERRRTAMMGGDFRTKALFYLGDRPYTGDEIRSDLFDEPRIITSVHPERAMDGSVTHWVAEMMTRSKWLRENRQSIPNVTFHGGQGNRVNVASPDQSTQQFHNDFGALENVVRALDEIKDAIAQLAPVPDQRDAIIDVEQIKLELQRSKPDEARVWAMLERVSTLAGMAETVAKVLPLVRTVLDGL